MEDATMTIQQFGAQVKTKYPMYGQYSDEEIGNRMLQKYPVYNNRIAPATPAMSASQTGDIESAQKYSPTFAASTENQGFGTGEAIKTVGNIPKSAFNFAKGAIDFLNPVSTFGKVKQAISEFKGLAGEAGGYGNATKALVGGLPKATYETVVPEAGRGVIKGVGGLITGNARKEKEGFEQAQRAITNDPVGQIAPFILAAKGGAHYADKLGITTGAEGALDTGISKVGQAGLKVADIATKPIQYVFGKGANLVKNATGFAARQTTGLNAETAGEFAKDTSLKPVDAEGLITKREELGGQIQEALANKKTELGVTPESLGKEVQSSLNKRMAELEDTGKAYQPVRGSASTIKVEPDFLKSTIEDTTGLKINDTMQAKEAYVDANTGELVPATEAKVGSITTDAGAKIRDAKDVRAVKNLYDKYQPLFDKGEMTTNEFLNMRSDLAKLSKFERDIGKSTDLEASSQIMRGKLNSAYRPQVEGLVDLDKEFSTQTGELKTLTKGLLDKNGTLTDSGLAKIAKATESKPQLLAQLEQVSPGITERISAYQQFNDLGKGLIDENGNITDAGMKKITNASNEANPQSLARLEEIKPGITKAIKQYKALQDVVNVSQKFKVATYRQSIGGLGVLGGIITGNPLLVAGAIAEMILTSPENAIKIIQTYVNTKSMMGNVLGKLKVGVAGTLDKINRSPEYLSKDISEIKTPAGMSIEDVSGGDYRYHETSLSNLQKIQERGLKPSRGMYGKGVYFSPEIGQGEATGRGLLIRSNLEDLNKFGFDEFKDVSIGKLGNEGWTDKTIAPQYLEFSKDGGKSWSNFEDKIISESKPNAFSSLAKKYKTSISKDGGSSWTVISGKSNFGK